jgi:hypothetical protein
MITFLFTLLTGFVLGLLYSRGKANPILTAKEDLRSMGNRLSNWAVSIFKPDREAGKNRDQRHFPRL